MDTLIVKNIAQKVLGLNGAYFDKNLHLTDGICADEWHCSIGDRVDELCLYEWTKERGIEQLPLPVDEREIYAYGYGDDKMGDVPYYNKEDVLDMLEPGIYILVYTEDIPSWDNSDREPMTTFDVFEVR